MPQRRIEGTHQKIDSNVIFKASICKSQSDLFNTSSSPSSLPEKTTLFQKGGTDGVSN